MIKIEVGWKTWYDSYNGTWKHSKKLSPYMYWVFLEAKDVDCKALQIQKFASFSYCWLQVHSNSSGNPKVCFKSLINDEVRLFVEV